MSPFLLLFLAQEKNAFEKTLSKRFQDPFLIRNQAIFGSKLHRFRFSPHLNNMLLNGEFVDGVIDEKDIHLVLS